MPSVSIGKNIAANILSNIWLMLLLLLLTPLYVWFLGVESYGLVGFYLSWIAIFGILDAGISATAVREIAWLAAHPEKRGNIPSLLKSLEVVYWGIILILGVVLLTGAWFFGKEWFHAKDVPPEVVRDAMMLMAISLIFQVPTGLYTGGLMALQRQVECSGLLVLFGTVRGITSVMVLWLISPDIRMFFMCQIFASLLQTGVMRWSLWRRVRMDGHPAKFSVKILQSIKGFLGTVMLITILGVVMSQADKMILSQLVSLEAFGFYMLAWTVASGLSRVATPLIQAFGPRFTELISYGNDEALAKQVLLASQLMSVVIMPPAALMMFLSEPIMFAWLGGHTAAEGTAPLLAILVVGSVLVSCSYPPVSILYSRKKLRPVVGVHLVCLFVILPLMVLAVVYFGAMGAAYIWGLYGLVLYVVYQIYGLRGLPNTGFLTSFISTFVAPCMMSLAVAAVAGYLLAEVSGKIMIAFFFTLALLVGWCAALLACKDLCKIVINKLK
jgi:O-antigen/teichoic acid export membrane protein